MAHSNNLTVLLAWRGESDTVGEAKKDGGLGGLPLPHLRRDKAKETGKV
jgi:hypothetical protein